MSSHPPSFPALPPTPLPPDAETISAISLRASAFPPLRRRFFLLAASSPPHPCLFLFILNNNGDDDNNRGVAPHSSSTFVAWGGVGKGAQSCSPVAL